MGKCSPSLRKKTLYNVESCNLSITDKTCIKAAFEKLESFEKSMEEVEVIRDHSREGTKMVEG